MKTHLDGWNDICPSCDVPYREHIGVAATCLALQRANKQIEELKEQLLKIVFQPNDSTAKLIDALKDIVTHQDMTGGSFARISSVRKIAAKAIHDATGEIV